MLMNKNINKYDEKVEPNWMYTSSSNTTLYDCITYDKAVHDVKLDRQALNLFNALKVF